MGIKWVGSTVVDDEVGRGMSRLFLLRHGQTEFNLQRRVQGRCDAPLTELGVEQAHSAAAWLIEQDVRLDRICSSPLGRARTTAELVRNDLQTAGASVPEVELVEDLQERCYGPFESGPASEVPCELWDPGEALVPYGGEGSRVLRERIVGALTDIMAQVDDDAQVLAVSHGSATLQFKRAWEHLAVCDQDVPLGNCCILVFEFDATVRTFTNTAIINQD